MKESETTVQRVQQAVGLCLHIVCLQLDNVFESRLSHRSLQICQHVVTVDNLRGKQPQLGI